MLFGLPYWLILVIPLGGSLLVPVFGKFNEKLRDWTPAIFMGIAMILCWSLLSDIGTHPETWMWISALGIEFGVILDTLSVVMAILASTLCFLIFVYSTEYMADEEDRNRFHFLMLAFGGGMLTLVLSDNLLIAFVGWEIMGFCSYGLIGFWNDRRNPPEKDPQEVEVTNPLLQFETEGQYNTHCGTKAFIVTRIGDAFMLAGILILFFFTGTFMFSEMGANGAWWGIMATAGMLVPTFLLLFMGAIGKSGQAPLQIWLPEAMAGPTAVSALIHAATMVKAGVYISARFLLTMAEAAGGGSHEEEAAIVVLQLPGLEAAAPFFMVVALIGGITAFMTATMGMVSNELKQVLAFSTLSQLGYMILAIGTAGLLEHYEHALSASVIHIVAHGAFKAALFLAAGGIIHAVHTKYMSNMGGLKKYMPKTFYVMLIGVFALSGIPPFSGFWSKDSIIEYTYHLALHSEFGLLLFILAVAAAACTIFYSIRLIGIVFLGDSDKSDDDHDDDSIHHSEETEEHTEEHHGEAHHATPHDPGPAMMIPVILLAAFTALAFPILAYVQGMALTGGLISAALWGEVMVEMVVIKFSAEGIVPFVITLGALALGGIPGYLIYIKGAGKNNTKIPEAGMKRRLYNFLKHRWYINEAMYWVVNKFLNFAEWWRVKIDDVIIDGIDFRSASLAITLSTKIRWFDDNIVDGFAEGVSTKAVSTSQSGQEFQTGRINDYVSVLIFGMGLLVLVVLIIMGVL